MQTRRTDLGENVKILRMNKILYPRKDLPGYLSTVFLSYKSFFFNGFLIFSFFVSTSIYREDYRQLLKKSKPFL